MPPTTLILGLGEPRRGNAGFGPGCIAELMRRWRFPDSVRVLDGTSGRGDLPEAVAAVRGLVVFASLSGVAPAAGLQIVQGRRVADILRAATTAEAAEMIDALDGPRTARPARMVLIGRHAGARATDAPGLQAERDVGPAVEAALTILRGWGVCPLAEAAERAGRLHSGVASAAPEAVG